MNTRWSSSARIVMAILLMGIGSLVTIMVSHWTETQQPGVSNSDEQLIARYRGALSHPQPDKELAACEEEFHKQGPRALDILFKVYAEESASNRQWTAHLIYKLLRVELAWNDLCNPPELGTRRFLTSDQVTEWQTWWNFAKDRRFEYGFPDSWWWDRKGGPPPTPAPGVSHTDEQLMARYREALCHPHPDKDMAACEEEIRKLGPQGLDLALDLYEEEAAKPVNAKHLVAPLIRKLLRIEFAWFNLMDREELEGLDRHELTSEEIAGYHRWWNWAKDRHDQYGFPDVWWWDPKGEPPPK